MSYLNGHIGNFYDFNKAYIGETSYLPTIYIAIAIWNIPALLLGLIDPEKIQTWITQFPSAQISQFDYAVLVGWYKCMLLFLAGVTAYYLKKINSMALSTKTSKSDLIFITSPITIFSVFVFSGYDILSVAFCMIAFYYHLKNNLLKFSLFFSLAITCKFFAILLFTPLLLLNEKRFFYLLKYSIIAISLIIFYILIYKNNLSFIESIFHVVKQKILSSNIHLLKMISLIAYIYICINAYLYKKNSFNEFLKKSLYVSYFSYFLLFIAFKWHPQWLIILMPFAALSYNYINNQKKYLAFEVVGFFSYVLLFTNLWKNNIDQKMMLQGPLSFMIPTTHQLIANIFPAEKLRFVAILLMYAYLIYPLFDLAIKPKIRQVINKKYIYARYACIYLFLILSFMTLLPAQNKIHLENLNENISLKCIYNHC
jgi:hypothetical protein